MSEQMTFDDIDFSGVTAAATRCNPPSGIYLVTSQLSRSTPKEGKNPSIVETFSIVEVRSIGTQNTEYPAEAGQMFSNFMQLLSTSLEYTKRDLALYMAAVGSEKLSDLVNATARTPIPMVIVVNYTPENYMRIASRQLA